MATTPIQATTEVYKILLAAAAIIFLLGGSLLYVVIRLFSTVTDDVKALFVLIKELLAKIEKNRDEILYLKGRIDGKNENNRLS